MILCYENSNRNFSDDKAGSLLLIFGASWCYIGANDMETMDI
jgi:hypothetical protein